MSRNIDENKPQLEIIKPEILSPAGDIRSALAAFAAGADAVYLGLKQFSARMQAENFSTAELARLADFAHAEGKRVYVAMNTMLKPNEPDHAFRLIRRLVLDVNPDALIIQDPAMLRLPRQAGYEGQLHLSTLANVTHPVALAQAASMGADRVIIPRELSIDEVRLMDEQCPEGLDLEIFIHGALCYCVSGRCWWSSYMGGKSGLRGRCVQPCRRVYTQKGRQGRFFSCLDLSLDVLTKSLLDIRHLKSWKIEGRKKGPHYVYYATTAYRLLRDEPNNPAARKEALGILEMALGRPGTHSRFLPQRPQLPTMQEVQAKSGKSGGKAVKKQLGQTTSGLLIGTIGKSSSGRFEFRPRIPMLAKDFLRVGYEDEPWHCTISIPKWVPQGAAFTLTLPKGKSPKLGTPVFLIDRQAPEMIALLNDWQDDMLKRTPERASSGEDIMGLKAPRPKAAKRGQARPLDILLRGSLPQGRESKAYIRPGTVQGLWLTQKALREVSRTLYSRISWWLPPVIWPDEEENWARMIVMALRGGARHFVCNEPWQMGFFKDPKGLSLTAGPFCNIASFSALEVLADAGFSQAIVSPELEEKDALSLPAVSPLPLGFVLAGFWPVGITRHKTDPVKAQETFASPKGEEFWLRKYGQNTWLYPAWPMDLTAHRRALEQAGYSTFVTIHEYPPKTVAKAERPGEFNWNVGLL